MEFSASVGFMHKEFVTTHGRMILKKKSASVVLEKEDRELFEIFSSAPRKSN
jgi:hypothetical protein